MRGNEYHLLVGLLSCTLHKPPIGFTLSLPLVTKFIEVLEKILILNVKEL
jgi:hypothetical protein